MADVWLPAGVLKATRDFWLNVYWDRADAREVKARVN